MTITTRSPTSNRSDARRAAGFTLVEIIIGAALSGFILAGVLSAFLFLGRSGANIQNYSDMESQARKALESFAEDVRQAKEITWTSPVQLTLTVNSPMGSAAVAYAYDSATGSFSRTDAAGTRRLVTGIVPGTFAFRSYNVAGVELPLVTAVNLAAASSSTKLLQISLEATRSKQTVVTATNTVLSARFILRNKIVTA
jgi:Tfp pilus assembly protein PilW